ncbi:MAG: hypothetical protein L0H70_10050 [Xanthomonadales bacterium]|nr:hypothetical protein [Xanthomonadales bacterium]
MNSDNSSDDVSALSSDQYQHIVAPVLQVAAELAAVRGDPDLVNDMPSMLALKTLVSTFAAFYIEQHPEADAAVCAAIDAAADGACAMALKRVDMDKAQIKECLWALGAASVKLREAGVLGPELGIAREAWHQLAGGNRSHAIAKLKLAAGGMVTAIDHWERARNSEPLA